MNEKNWNFLLRALLSRKEKEKATQEDASTSSQTLKKEGAVGGQATMETSKERGPREIVKIRTTWETQRNPARKSRRTKAKDYMLRVSAPLASSKAEKKSPI